MRPLSPTLSHEGRGRFWRLSIPAYLPTVEPSPLVGEGRERGSVVPFARHANRSPGTSRSSSGTSGVHRNNAHTSALGLNRTYCQANAARATISAYIKRI